MATKFKTAGGVDQEDSFDDAPAGDTPAESVKQPPVQESQLPTVRRSQLPSMSPEGKTVIGYRVEYRGRYGEYLGARDAAEAWARFCDETKQHPSPKSLGIKITELYSPEK